MNVKLHRFSICSHLFHALQNENLTVINEIGLKVLKYCRLQVPKVLYFDWHLFHAGKRN